MTLQEAKNECNRWLAHLDRQKKKALEIQKIAAMRRNEEIDEQEARRRIRQIDGVGVTVFDAANLEKAVRLLLKHLED